uniref:Plant heme peroxidase family profile domain-containing protein n=1 Tax=Chromera velia CCMP2878 TaxID=1169474 RepID=A0A0G4G4G4_9ALVE|eukprot:Cvel_4161.t1-p1 / transcript=Cvel_4161.t1 / gene=Cvel_4161 / organism=Chromera_velia_CCMP2878 / gene_product=Putative ascorbate peroxidase, putative / transcript_product=Putative ascorbate peroxidase, putative / location=Cvel_scaffold179:22831-25577(+) / protein_length=179 / sequence_SO=supercontig / SO=protein_coding / is_pseudo=false
MGFVLALLCACALAFQKASAGWTTDLANNCISDIESAIEASLTGRRLQGGKGGKGGKGGGAARQGGSTRRLIPQLVRLSFHDCVGGCDGCVNLDDPDNAGLAGPRTSLETIYSDRGLADEGVSRADLWALAGKVAVEYAALLAGSTISIPFYTGRSDCADSPGTSSIDGMPSAHLDVSR